MKPGDPARSNVDAHPQTPLCGYVESIAPASGTEFALIPPDNATGNFTKIVRRFNGPSALKIRARGERISDYSCREMSMMAEAHFARHRDELINKAAADVATFPGFSRYRVECAELLTAAQTQSQPKSITSTVHMSGAK